MRIAGRWRGGGAPAPVIRWAGPRVLVVADPPAAPDILGWAATLVPAEAEIVVVLAAAPPRGPGLARLLRAGGFTAGERSQWPVRVVAPAYGATRAGVAAAGQLADELRRPVLAPCGPVALVPGGTVFTTPEPVSDGRWRRFEPGAAPGGAPGGDDPRYPGRGWSAAVDRCASACAGEAGGVTVTAIPAGLWVSGDGATAAGREAAFAIPAADTPLLLLGEPDAAELDPAGVVAALLPAARELPGTGWAVRPLSGHRRGAAVVAGWLSRVSATPALAGAAGEPPPLLVLDGGPIAVADWWQPDPALLGVLTGNADPDTGEPDASVLGERIAGGAEWGGRPVVLADPEPVAGWRSQLLADQLQVPVLVAADARWYAVLPRSAAGGTRLPVLVGEHFPPTAVAVADAAGSAVPIPITDSPAAGCPATADVAAPGADRPEPSRHDAADLPAGAYLVVLDPLPDPRLPFLLDGEPGTCWQVAAALWTVRDRWQGRDLALEPPGIPPAHAQLLANYLGAVVWHRGEHGWSRNAPRVRPGPG